MPGRGLLSRHANDGYELARILAEARVAPDPAIVSILAAEAERAARRAPLVAAGWFAEGGVQEGFCLESCYLHGEWETILDIAPVIGVGAQPDQHDRPGTALDRPMYLGTALDA